MLGSVLILISMFYKSTTRRGNILMRIWNLLGSVLFIIYGLCIHSFSTVLLNVIVVPVHLYHIVATTKEGDNSNKHC